MRQKFTSFKELALLVCLCFTVVSTSLAQTANFSLSSHNEKVDVAKTFTKESERVDIPIKHALTALGINATIELKKISGSVRVIFLDDFNNEYLVYESNTLLNDKQKFIINKAAEETSQLDNVTPSHLRIELLDAEITLHSILISDNPVNTFGRKATLEDIKSAQVKEKIYKINQQLKKQKLNWIAGVTSHSNLTYAEKKVLFGGKSVETYGFEHYVGGIFQIPGEASNQLQGSVQTQAAASPFVSEYSWRNRHGKDWMTPTRDQGGCGSCWVFAAVGAAEAYANVYLNKVWNYDLSEQQLGNCASTSMCNGGTPAVALDKIVTIGAKAESCSPYQAKDMLCSQLPTCTPGFVLKIDSSFYIGPSDVMKEIIKRPITISVMSWSHALTVAGYKIIKGGDNIYISGSGSAGGAAQDRFVTISPTDPLIGQTAYLIKNSWGSGWGVGGFGYVNSTNLFFYGPGGKVTVTTPTDGEVQRTIEDADGDGYYTWGSGPRPTNLPATAKLYQDGDDSNATLGRMDGYGNIYPADEVIVNVTGVTVNPSSASVVLYSSAQLTATVLPSNATNKNVKWSTSNSAVVGVVASGTISGWGLGTATITATTEDGSKIATCVVTVTESANTLPTVNITSPANNATFTAGTNITINANAADSDGTITKVEFYNGSTKLGEDLSSPYSFVWNSVTAGTYSLIAKATDNVGGAKTSSAISIAVSAGANIAPTVAITSPANNATFTAGTNITINANATNSDGTITKVEFYNGSTKLGEDLSSPYSFVWSSVVAGTYSLTAKATDNGGAVTTSSAISITVSPASTLRDPENPANAVNGLDYSYYEGTWSVLPNFTTLTAVKTGTETNFNLTNRNRNDQFAFKFTGYVNVPTDGTYTFYTSSDDGSKLYIGTTQVVNNDGLHGNQEQSGTIGLKAGKHAITVTFFENSGGELLSVSYAGTGITKTVIPASALYRVGAINVAPSVNITSPANSATFTAGTNITINANASDSDGTITKVEFYNGSTKLGEDLTSPYSFVWSSVVAGTYSLTAKATDNGGAVTTSSAISITVSPASTLRDPENPANAVNGLDYSYYEGSWSSLPDFTTLTAVKTGVVANFELTPRNRNDQFAFKYTGYVNVPTDGTYTFYTSSDDGSKLYIGTTQVVNNDGLHGNSERSGTIGLKAGKHAVTVTFFEQGGDEILNVSYASTGISKTVIPSSALYKIETPVSAFAKNEVNDSETLEVHPNPVTDNLYITGNEINAVVIYNLQGKPVIALTKNYNVVNLSGLAEGIYLLQVRTNKKVYTRKIFKQ